MPGSKLMMLVTEWKMTAPVYSMICACGVSKPSTAYTCYRLSYCVYRWIGSGCRKNSE